MLARRRSDCLLYFTCVSTVFYVHAYDDQRWTEHRFTTTKESLYTLQGRGKAQCVQGCVQGCVHGCVQGCVHTVEKQKYNQADTIVYIHQRLLSWVIRHVAVHLVPSEAILPVIHLLRHARIDKTTTILLRRLHLWPLANSKCSLNAYSGKKELQL